MKGKFFKKLIASVSALSMLGSLAFAVPASAATTVYSQDFENVDVASLGATLGANSTQRIQKNVAGNSTSFYNVYTSGANNDRTSTLPINAAVTGKAVTYSMKLKAMGANTNASTFSINGAGGSIFTFTYNSYMGSPAMNGDSVTLTTANAANGEMGASNYASTSWLDVSVTVDFRKSPAAAKAVVKEGTKIVHEKLYMTTATNITALSANIGKSNGAVAYDDISIVELTDAEVNAIIPATYTVTFKVDGVTTTEVVAGGGFAKAFPETAKLGYFFLGWAKDGNMTTLYTTEEAKALAINTDTTFEAVYKEDKDYIEALTSVVFDSFPSGNMLVAGADENTPASNIISVKATGEGGTNLLANPDSRVKDLDVKYEFKGFRWIASQNRATSDIIDNEYCDSYGKVVIDNDAHTADFQVKNHPFNYYGEVVATVTYNGKTMSVSRPLAYLGSTTPVANQILPRPGYISDFNNYSPDMIGYVTASSGDNRNGSDVAADNWASFGSGVKALTLTGEGSAKFMRLSTTGKKSDGGNGSAFANNQISNVADSQVIFSQKVRFDTNSSILLKSTYPTNWPGKDTVFTLSFDKNSISLNGSAICAAAAGKWYTIIISSDLTSEKCYAEVYDENGTNKLGSSEIVATSGATSGTYYMFRISDGTAGNLDFNDVVMTRAEIDDTSLKATPKDETLSVPETAGETVSTTIDLTAKTTSGLPALGKAEWSIADESQTDYVTIVPAEDDSHTATLTVSPGAAAGELVINVLIGGKSTSAAVNLSSSQDSVRFVTDGGKSPASISIPMSGSDSYTYEAQVIDKNGTPYPGKAITYALYDSSNTNPIAAPAGMTFENGVLTVSQAAKAAVIYVRATSTNSENETITRARRVDIHGLAFDFGAGTPDDVVEGYTAVTPSSIYSQGSDYGIVGTAAAGGDASIENANSDYLSGTYTFNAKVEPGKIYNVEITYQGTLAFEYINDYLTGVVRENAAGLSTLTYNVPVMDDVLDIALSGDNAKIASIVISPQDAKSPKAKPHIYTVGDSTIANNGSWAYVLNRDQGNYPELTDLAGFSNTGRGGRNLGDYYTGGDFWNNVVNAIQPGDYVMIGDMGTNGCSVHHKEDLNYYIDTCRTLGANVILNSYTPHGAVGGYANGYNRDTHTFDSYRRDSGDPQLRELYEERKADLAGFVEIGKNADAAFNAYVADYKTNGYANENAAADAIIACFGDHNHYSKNGLACKLMIEGYGGVKGIVKQLVDILDPPNPVKDVIDSAVNGEAEFKETVDGENNTVRVPADKNVVIKDGGKITRATLVPKTGDTVTVEIIEDGKTTKVTGESIYFNEFGKISASDGMEAEINNNGATHDTIVFDSTYVVNDSVTYTITDGNDTTHTEVVPLDSEISGDARFGLLIEGVPNGKKLTVTVE